MSRAFNYHGREFTNECARFFFGKSMFIWERFWELIPHVATLWKLSLPCTLPEFLCFMMSIPQIYYSSKRGNNTTINSEVKPLHTHNSSDRDWIFQTTKAEQVFGCFCFWMPANPNPVADMWTYLCFDNPFYLTQIRPFICGLASRYDLALNPEKQRKVLFCFCLCFI